MVFDRTAMATGRGMQDFGLCDLKGVYQHTSRLRGKGFLAIGFVEATDLGTKETIATLADWTSVSPKVSAAIVATGERENVESIGEGSNVPILWDPDGYVAQIWSITAVPTVFIINDKGLVLGRVRGTNASEISAAKELLAEEVRKADEAAAAAAAAKAAADAAKK